MSGKWLPNHMPSVNVPTKTKEMSKNNDRGGSGGSDATIAMSEMTDSTGINDWEDVAKSGARQALAAAKALSFGLCTIGEFGADSNMVSTLTLEEEENDYNDDFRENGIIDIKSEINQNQYSQTCEGPSLTQRISSSLNGNISESSPRAELALPQSPMEPNLLAKETAVKTEITSNIYDGSLLNDLMNAKKRADIADSNFCLPNKSEIKPDSEGTTIIAQTVGGGCSTLTPSPEEHFGSNDYSAQPMTMVAPAGPNPFDEEVYENESNADLDHDWKNPSPSHSSLCQETDSDFNQIGKKRKFYAGLVALLFLVILSVAIAVPLAIKSKNSNNTTVILNNAAHENANHSYDVPSIAPTIHNKKMPTGKINHPSLEPTSSSVTKSPNLSITELQPTPPTTAIPSQLMAKTPHFPSSKVPSTSGKIAPLTFIPSTAEVSLSPITSPIFAPGPTLSSPASEPTAIDALKYTSFPTANTNGIEWTLIKSPTYSPGDLAATKQPANEIQLTPIESPTNSPVILAATKQPTSNTNAMTPSIDAAPDSAKPTELPEKTCITIEIQTDEFGYETSWSLASITLDEATNTNISTLIAFVNENSYAAFEKSLEKYCVSAGTYQFTLKDAYGDGFGLGGGSYVVSLDDREIIRGKSFKSEISYDILIGYDPLPLMSERDVEWLEAHNVRRKVWHESNGKSYVPLRWSVELEAGASYWADQLLNECDIPGVRHEPGIEAGENLAKNRGQTEKGMGILYPPENIMKRWVDQESTWGYPENAHLTQALWRGSTYLGCGDAVKKYDDGSICRVQVCRYARAGNCAMNSFNATIGDNWLVPMLEDFSACAPTCPPEGCY